MQLTILLIAILALVVIGLYFGRRRALRAAGSDLSKLHSMPSYHGWYVALWCGIPSGIVLIVWLIIEARDPGNVVTFLSWPDGCPSVGRDNRPSCSTTCGIWPPAMW